MIETLDAQFGCDLRRFMRIAMDLNSDRNVRLAAEALASAILNGTPERKVCSEALEILLEEDELQAVEALDVVFGSAYREN